MSNQDAIAILKAKISANASRRIRDALEDLTRPKILHTQYLGDRTVQQLGQEPIENAVILNNAANAIGDALMPLAKGSPLQRFDSVNQDDGVGSARRSLLERDAIANGQSTFRRGNGEETPVNNPIIGTPRGRDPLPQDYPPPFGCVPLYPAKQCIWIPTGTSPSGYQSHGSAVINQDGLELFLHCQDGVVPPPDLGCTFLARWKCVDGVCTQDPNGTYSTQSECEAARTLLFTGGQCAGTAYTVTWSLIGSYLGGAPTGLIVAQAVTGAISAIYWEWENNVDGNSYAVAVIVAASGTTRTGAIATGTPFVPGWVITFEIISITGTPDNCGDRYTCG